MLEIQGDSKNKCFDNGKYLAECANINKDHGEQGDGE